MDCRHLINTIDWDKLRAFYYVAQTGSFTRASESLNISQSSLSRAVQVLEERLGVQLFIRASRKLVLTDQGGMLLQTTKQMFSDLEATLPRLQASDRPEGMLRVNTTMGLSSWLIFQYVPEFLAKYPHIQLTFLANNFLPDFDLLEADVALQPFMEERDDLVQRLLFSDTVHLYASRTYLEKYGIPKTTKDLDNHRLVGFGDPAIAQGNQSMNWHLFAGAQEGEIRAPYIQSNVPQGRFLFAKMGLGIAALGGSLPSAEEHDLVEVLPDIEKPHLDVYYIYPVRMAGVKRLQVFGEFLAEKISKDYADRHPRKKRGA